MTTLSSDQAQALDQQAALDETPQQGAEKREQRIDASILAVLYGGTVLVTSIVAQFVFDAPVYAEYLAMLASILLGGPIVWGAAKSVWHGYCSHEEHKHAHDHDHDHAGHAAHAVDHDHAEVTPHDDQAPSHTHGATHMEELVALAVIAAFASGQYLECAAVAFFMLIASLIEHRTAVGALKSIESLIRLTPTKAVKLLEGGKTEEVAASSLAPGDRVLVRPGDNIPGDGVIRSGFSSINQANITGESMPVEKTEGDEVFGGTINQTGRLEIEITRAGQDSTLGKVQALILQAAQSRPAVVRELAKYASYYTPVILMLAGIVFLVTQDLNNSITLLLIACPCALILAGPTAIVAALSAAARLGVLVKSVEHLEIVRRVTAFVFDKTGTLTTGNLAVVRMRPAHDVDAEELLRLAVSAEHNSTHPVARAVVDVAEKAHVQPQSCGEFEEIPGRGVRAVAGDQEILVGRESFLGERGVDVSSLDTEGTDGLSLLFVARNGQAMGWVGLADTLREDAADSVSELGELGVKRRVMITGDRESPAMRVADQISLTDVRSEALPGDKLKLVEELRNKGHTVAVIGDGVNDAPALAAGHVSVAMGAAGSDVAVHNASIALMNNHLDRLPFLVRLSRRTLNVIRQNLAFTLAYILIMVALLAIAASDPVWAARMPIIAAIGHGLSSIIVVFNSARLVREGEEVESEGIQAMPWEIPTETKKTVAPSGAPAPATA